MSKTETRVLWRPIGRAELELIKETQMTGFPPRLPHQPFFYPVLSKEYATKIARDWNAVREGQGFVTRFQVRKSFLDHYDVKEVGGREHSEYWIPSTDMDAFNAAIVGKIEVVEEFSAQKS
jgi:hypothetical protein